MRTITALSLLLGLALTSCAGDDSKSDNSQALAPVTALVATQGDGQLALAWVNPTFADFAGVTLRRDTSGAPATPTSGVLVYEGTGLGVVDSALANGVRYYYAAFAHDTAGRYAAGTLADAVPNPASPVQLAFAGVGGGGGDHGIFDPSLALDPVSGRIWMAYSEVIDSPLWPGQNRFISTRIGWSDDQGANWADQGVINPAQDVTIPLAPPNNAGTWVNETPSLVYDAAAPASERWKLMWMRYLLVNGVRHFEHGWMALKTAPDPAGTWSAERKLFVGSLYDTSNNAIIGPPEVQLDQLHPDLNAMLVAAEPGLLADASGLYVALYAAEGLSTNGRLALLRLPVGQTTWQYRGSLLVNATDGPLLGFDGYSAPSLFEKAGQRFLVATPENGDYYLGAQVFAVSNLSNATLQRASGTPVVAFSHFGTAGSFNGAAAYIPQATASGLLYSEAVVTSVVEFRIYASRRNP